MDPKERTERLEKVVLALESQKAEAIALDAGALADLLEQAIDEGEGLIAAYEWPD